MLQCVTRSATRRMEQHKCKFAEALESLRDLLPKVLRRDDGIIKICSDEMSLEALAFLSLPRSEWKSVVNAIDPNLLFAWHEPLLRFVRKMESVLDAIDAFLEAATTQNLTARYCVLLRGRSNSDAAIT